METIDNVIPLIKPPTISEAKKIIRELTQKGQISWSNHCKQRMKERGITTPQILNCLSKGKVTEPPFYSYQNGGGFETSVEKGAAGDWLKVVICMKHTQTLLVITAIN